tara:strand:- start:10 stop:300 length:291 start_codon:yes stop_codon:yes gene_type:complete
MIEILNMDWLDNFEVSVPIEMFICGLSIAVIFPSAIIDLYFLYPHAAKPKSAPPATKTTSISSNKLDEEEIQSLIQSAVVLFSDIPKHNSYNYCDT